MQDCSHQKLADHERQSHRPGRQRVALARQHQGHKTGHEVPGGAEHDGTRQRAGGCGDSETDQQLPQARKHPQRFRRKPPQHHGQQRARRARGQELLDRLVDHRIGETGMMPTRTRSHLHPDDARRDQRGGGPPGEKDHRLSGRIVEPQELRDRGDQRQTAGGGDRRRTIAAERRAGGNLAANRKDVGQRLVEIPHLPTLLYIAKYTRSQSDCKRR